MHEFLENVLLLEQRLLRGLHGSSPRPTSRRFVRNCLTFPFKTKIRLHGPLLCFSWANPVQPLGWAGEGAGPSVTARPAPHPPRGCRQLETPWACSGSGRVAQGGEGLPERACPADTRSVTRRCPPGQAPEHGRRPTGVCRTVSIRCLLFPVLLPLRRLVCPLFGVPPVRGKHHSAGCSCLRSGSPSRPGVGVSDGPRQGRPRGSGC